MTKYSNRISVSNHSVPPPLNYFSRDGYLMWGKAFFQSIWGGKPVWGGKAYFACQGGGKFELFLNNNFFYQFITDIIYKIWCPDIYFLNFITNGTFW